MQIQYFGLTSFKLTSKDRVAVIDPFSKESGLTPPRGNADLVILSQAQNELYSYTQSLSSDFFVVDGPGEYDVKDHAITGIPIKGKDGKIVTIYLIEVEGLKILDLAHIKSLTLTQDELEDIGDVDIVFVPVGGGEAMEFDDAAKAINLIEPKIAIPMYYKFDGLKIDAYSADKFLKEMGGKNETLDKLTIKKKDILPDDTNTRVIVLEPLR